MSEELFEIKTCSVPELELARRELDAVCEEYDRADPTILEATTPEHKDIVHRLIRAQERLAKAELDELNKA